MNEFEDVLSDPRLRRIAEHAVERLVAPPQPMLGVDDHQELLGPFDDRFVACVRAILGRGGIDRYVSTRSSPAVIALADERLTG